MDGTLDIHAFSGAAGSPDFFINNRGYGSFMLPEKYEAGLFPAFVHNNLGKRGVATGDVTGDGANDLFIAGVDGSLWLLVNQTLAHRRDQAEKGTVLDERKRISSRSVTVALEGPRGVTGAWLRLRDGEGHLVAARQIAGNVNVGSSGPHQVTFTVREPGPHRLEVVWSHGARLEKDIDLSAGTERHRLLRIPPP